MSAQERDAREIFDKHLAGLSPAARERVLNRVEAHLPSLVGKHAGLRAREELAAVQPIIEWMRAERFHVERNDCTRAHKLSEAINERKLVSYGKDTHEATIVAAKSFEGAPSFLIQHDWAAAFKNATDYAGGTYRLPFDECVLEFRLSGRTVLVGLVDQPSGARHGYIFIQADAGYWWFPGVVIEGDKSASPVYAFCEAIWEHVRAVCVALDAEVAYREIVRGPPKLNEARARKGEPPVRDYHIIRLRGRLTGRADSFGGTHRSPRLHFRRGHWRHLATHTVWVKWCLVGDPDLGFIEKDYRL